MSPVLPATERRRGAAAVEMAVVLPLLVTLLAGLLEFARMIEVEQSLVMAVGEGARQASTGALSASQVQQAVLAYLSGAGLPTAHAVVRVQNLTNPGVDPTAATQFDQFQVSVTLPYSDVRLLDYWLFTSSNTTLSAKTVWLSGRDKPYPVPPEPPIE